jgi:hypothetical protein
MTEEESEKEEATEIALRDRERSVVFSRLAPERTSKNRPSAPSLPSPAPDWAVVLRDWPAEMSQAAARGNPTSKLDCNIRIFVYNEYQRSIAMQNVGTIDRVLRTVLGLVLIAAPFVGSPEMLGSFASGGTWWWVPVAVGLVLLATAAVRFCPLYRLIGVRTCRVR